jgi:asparagine synthase (glutamine-hydrolysing)
MCGIAGILRFDGQAVDPRALARMTQALAHRGPDGGDHWFAADGSAGLGHRRLSILDTSDDGRQPMVSHDGRYRITYNGEIYNFLELRAELGARGHRFLTQSDTEVLLAAFREWGEAMLSRLNGMWAFAIHDEASGHVFLARDRFGVKPLLYSWSARHFLFASEDRALVASGMLDGALDTDAITRGITDVMRIEGSARTMRASIARIQGGHCAWVSAQGVAVRRWWSTLDHLVDVPAKPEARAERFRELFYNSIGLRMRSDVPIGTCLSGGFDSSAITCAMAELAGVGGLRQAESWRHAFVASFPGWSLDERPQAEEAAAYAGIDPDVLEIKPDNALGDLEHVLDDLGDIYLAPAIGPWLIYREVRKVGVVVTLDGHGADEMFGAYRPARATIRHFLQTAAAGLASRSAMLRGLRGDVRDATLRAQGYNFLRDCPGMAPPLVGEGDRLPSSWGSLSRTLYEMFHSTILPTLLRNFDRMSMAHGVEVRMPFMDWRLVTYVMSLPDAAKLSDGYTKLVAREAMRGRMPESIRTTRRKIGFGSPMRDYLQGPLNDWTRRLLTAPSPAFDTIVDSRRLLTTVDRLTSENRWTLANSERLWPYINLAYLLRNS